MQAIVVFEDIYIAPWLKKWLYAPQISYIMWKFHMKNKKTKKHFFLFQFFVKGSFYI